MKTVRLAVVALAVATASTVLAAETVRVLRTNPPQDIFQTMRDFDAGKLGPVPSVPDSIAFGPPLGTPDTFKRPAVPDGARITILRTRVTTGEQKVGKAEVK